MDAQSWQKLLEKKQHLLALPQHQRYRALEDIYHQKTTGEYVGDLVYGANDGVITTFAIVAGASGAALSPLAVIALGLANLLADGLSMGLGNYLATKSECEYREGQRKKEQWEVENLREIEVHEVHGILDRWGLDGELKEQVTERIISSPDAWLDIMMREELGILEEQTSSPARHGAATFVAFVVAGAIPLLPFLLSGLFAQPLLFSAALAALTLFVVGALRSCVSVVNWWRGGLEMLAIGSAAAIVAYAIGLGADRLFGG